MDSDILATRSTPTLTYRAVAQGLEEILYTPLPVLDHGFVRVIDYMGNDSAIVQAARVSYGAGTKKIQEDEGLIRYLMRHMHSTPFEMCEIKYHIKLPIFIARQWIRHRTANVNEYSARYSVMDKEFYIPDIDHLSTQSTTNRQGRGDTLTLEQSNRVLELLKQDSVQVYEHYLEMLNQGKDGAILDADKTGLSRELARMNLTLNYYTQWYWKIDLHNLCHFLRLRADSHAQYEIQAYAKVMMETVKKWVPIAYQAFLDYRHHGVQLSAPALAVVKRLLAGEEVDETTSGLGKREWAELQGVLQRP
jgi:thymidylate synthase (FAD)